MYGRYLGDEGWVPSEPAAVTLGLTETEGTGAFGLADEVRKEPAKGV